MPRLEETVLAEGKFLRQHWQIWEPLRGIIFTRPSNHECSVFLQPMLDSLRIMPKPLLVGEAGGKLVKFCLLGKRLGSK